MQPGGQAEVDRAKADGRWDAAYRMADSDVPADLQAALDANPVAAAACAVLTKQNRCAIVFRLVSVKRTETRERKLHRGRRLQAFQPTVARRNKAKCRFQPPRRIRVQSRLNELEVVLVLRFQLFESLNQGN